MLKDLDGIFAAFERWGTQHPVMAWLIMGWLGGIVAAVRMYERAGIKFTWGSFLARGCGKGVIGVFVALCAYAGWRAMGWSQDWGLLAGGLCGVFGTDILEAVLVLGWDFIRKRAGLAPAQMPKDSNRGTPADGS